MKIKTIYFGAILLCSISLNAQKNHFESGELAYNNEKFFTAIESYKKAEVSTKKIELKAEINFKIALCYAELLDIEQAEVYLNRATGLKYDKTNPELIFQMADVLMQQGNYKGAKLLFEKYEAKKPSDVLVKNRIASCDKAESTLASPTKHLVQAEIQLNDEFYEYAPSFGDKRMNELLFASTRPGTEGDKTDERTGQSFSDIWTTTRDAKGKWGEPQLLPPAINTEHNEGTPLMNKKKDALYFTRCNVIAKKNIGCDIYYAEKTGSRWKDAEIIKLKPAGADSLSVGHPALNNREDVLVFSSDLPGGSGGKDLWMSSFDKKTKTWGEPQNLGPVINTAGDEVFPYLDKNNELYFSSNGHIGLGGLDLFKAAKKEDNSWHSPANLNFPLNSERDDFGIVLEKENRGFLSSNRKNGKGLDDIYSFNLIPSIIKIDCIVKDATNNKAIPNATIRLSNSNNEVFEITTDADGLFTFDKINENKRYVESDLNYSLEASAPAYVFASSKLSTIGLEESKRFIEEFMLYPIDKPIDLPEVRYDYDDTLLQVIANKVNSEDSLNSLYDKMIEFPNWVVELQAHTDCRGSELYNKNLSQGRANSCVAYLVAKGIAKERLVPVGYGENVPIKGLSCDAIKGMATKEEQEKAHQRNRRTQFKILSSDFKE